MGVLNVTPDSFSDGGRWADTAAAVERAREMVAEGAEVIDVGGESTRPGAAGVEVEVELRRVLPVLEALASEGIGRLSIDTRKEEVARAAVSSGATLINDVSGTLWPVAAETGCGWVSMHMPAEPSVMQERAVYHDVVAEVLDHVVAGAERARAAGVDEVWIDPGIGFGKTGSHNLTLLRHLDDFAAAGWPVLVGTSRKSFLGRVAVDDGEEPLPPADRLEGSVATAAWAVLHGASMVRVHDVRPAVMAVRLAGAHGRSGAEPRRAVVGGAVTGAVRL